MQHFQTTFPNKNKGRTGGEWGQGYVFSMNIKLIF